MSARIASFKVYSVDEGTSEMIIQADSTKKNKKQKVVNVKELAQPQHTTMDIKSPDHVIVIYKAYEKMIHPHPGEQVHFFVDGPILEFCPMAKEYEALADETVLFDSSCRHQMFMDLEGNLAFCLSLQSTGEGQHLRCQMVATGTTVDIVPSDLRHTHRINDTPMDLAPYGVAYYKTVPKLAHPKGKHEHIHAFVGKGKHDAEMHHMM